MTARAARRCRRAALSGCWLLAACGPERAPLQELSGPTMGTTWRVKWAGEAASRARVAAAVGTVLADFDAALSTWRDDSAISRFNAHASTDPFTIPQPLRAALVDTLRLALEVAERSDGAFDPTIEPVVALLGFGREDAGAGPTPDQLAEALRHVGWRRLRILEDGRLQKDDPQLRINCNAVAPGMAADAIAGALAELGVSACMVDIGGEIRCRGRKPDGSAWQIGIERPTPPGEDAGLHTVTPVEGGLATSGDYRNFRCIEGEVVHHILDPRTGRNVRHRWASVTVWADSAGLADALATALMVLGPERSAALLDSYAGRGARALFLGAPGADGQVEELSVGR